jgi:hypothetical protein
VFACERKQYSSGASSSHDDHFRITYHVVAISEPSLSETIQIPISKVQISLKDIKGHGSVNLCSAEENVRWDCREPLQRKPFVVCGSAGAVLRSQNMFAKVVHSPCPLPASAVQRPCTQQTFRPPLLPPSRCCPGGRCQSCKARDLSKTSSAHSGATNLNGNACLSPKWNKQIYNEIL